MTRNVHPTGHTRLPRYARGKRGTIHRVRGVLRLPDTNAHGLGEQPQPLYTRPLRRAASCGATRPSRARRVYLDLWESYLEADA